MSTFLSRSLIVLSLLLTAFTAHAADPNAYRLGPGDSLHITVFGNTALTLDTQVADDGTITYPLAGAVKVAGLPVHAAEQAIAAKLESSGMMREPQVNILVTQVQANQVSVLGQVNRPGRFPLMSAGVHVADAIAMAGGITPTGADQVIVSGTREGKPFRRTVDLGNVFLDKDAAADVELAGGDILYVNHQPMFYIYGEAQRPGQYRVERNMTVMQALAEGGGPTTRGTDHGLRLQRRNADGSTTQLSPKLTDPVQDGDVIYVSQAIF